MKKSYVTNKEGLGAFVGKLSKADELTLPMTTENGLHIQKLHLTKNLQETPDNDVLILGKMKEDQTEIEVDYMESLSLFSKEDLEFIQGNELLALSIPKAHMKSKTPRFSENGTPFTEIVCSKKGTKALTHINVFGEFLTKEEDKPYVLLLAKPLTKKETEVGTGYAKKTVLSYYGLGWQLI